MSRGWASLLALVSGVLVVTGAAVAPALAATPPAGMFGIGDWSQPSPATLDREAAHGLRTWRVSVSFADVSPRPDTLVFDSVDRVMADLAARGIEPVVVLTGCPWWACLLGGPPKDEPARSAWLKFVAAIVGRYGEHGSYWAAHPDVPAQPVRYWQILNEVNGWQGWPWPDPAAYAAFLGATSQTIRAADPAAKVVLAGLAEKLAIWMKDYLAALYRQPGFAASADVIAVQAYAVTPLDVVNIAEQAHQIMASNGDGRPLWITEMSWATGGPPFPFVVDEGVQAASLQTSFDELLGCAARWNLQRVYWFGWEDETVPPDRDYWGYHNGLTRVDGSPKPALAAFDQYTSGAPLPGGRGEVCPLDTAAAAPPPAAAPPQAAAPRPKPSKKRHARKPRRPRHRAKPHRRSSARSDSKARPRRLVERVTQAGRACVRSCSDR